MSYSNALLCFWPVFADEVPVCWRERLLYYDLYLDLTICGSTVRAPDTSCTGSGTGFLVVGKLEHPGVKNGPEDHGSPQNVPQI